MHKHVGKAHNFLKVSLNNPFCLFENEKLKTIWPSHSIALRTFSITWMQSVVRITNDFLKGGPWHWKTWLENKLVVLSLIITLVQKIKWTILFKCSTTTKMKLNELKGGKFVKFMEIENHDNAGINDGYWSPCGQWWGFFAHAQTLHDPTKNFMYLHTCGHQ
jgi:hypothetical protein